MLWFRPNCLGSGRWRKVRGQSARNGFSFHGLIPPKLQQLQSGEEVDAPGGKSILTMSPRRRLEKCAYDGWERTERVWDSWGRGSFSSGNSELIWEKAWMFFSLDDYSFRSRESFSKNQIVSQQLAKDLIYFTAEGSELSGESCPLCMSSHKSMKDNREEFREDGPEFAGVSLGRASLSSVTCGYILQWNNIAFHYI